MICYRCNHEAGNHAECPICGTDLKVFQRVRRLSNMYYNDGLQKAEVRNLSGAIISLKKSLKLNKYNIEARNLLGLVYYEMGEVVDALSEWVISKSYQQDDNAAGRYLEEIRQNRAQLDAINQTIKKYNQALLYCKQDSRDLAIIQLKKVLALNPKLVRGHQLLALLYLQEDKLELAKKTLRNAGKIDANNTITLRYLKEVNAKLRENGGNKKKKEEDLISYQSGNEMIIMPNRFQDYSLGSTLVYLLIGLVIGALAIGFLVVPGVKSAAMQNMKDTLAEANDTISSNADQIKRLEAQIKDLEEQLKPVEGEDGTVSAQTAAYEALLSSYVAYIGEDFMTAGKTLEAIDTTQLSTTALNVYNNLNATIAPKYYEEVYSAGYSSYSSNDYPAAIEQLLRVVNYDKSFRKGAAAYYLAQSYRKNGDIESARPYYQFVVDNFPGSKLAATAKNYINGN